MLGDGIHSSGTAAQLVLLNCTVVDNAAADPNSIGIQLNGGSCAMTNSIVWGHGSDLLGFPVDGSGNLPGVWYSDIGDGQNAGAQGCLSIDPLFADDVYYHLQSTEGHYRGGYFGGGDWTTAAANSPLIDLGDPATDFSREPDPNGGVVNLGAYGNVEVAAMTPDIEVAPPSVVNSGARAWGHRTAILRGEVTDDGGQFPQIVFHYWQAGGATTLHETRIQGNSVVGDLDVIYAADGGALANAGGAVWLRNVLVAGNSAGPADKPNRVDGLYTGGAVADTVVESSTFADNNAEHPDNVGIHCGGGLFAMTNTIVWGHARDLSNAPTNAAGQALGVAHSLFNDATMDGVAGCVSADPLFADPAGGDYRLGIGSPAINVGKTLPWMIGATDLAGVKRIQSGAVDLGAYEVPGAAATIILVR